MSKIVKKKRGNFVFWISLLLFFLSFFAFFSFKRASLKQKKIPESLNSRQRNILSILSSEGEVTVEQLMSEIKGVTERTFRRDMKKLEELGLSAKQGNTKGSKYIYTN